MNSRASCELENFHGPNLELAADRRRVQSSYKQRQGEVCAGASTEHHGAAQKIVVLRRIPWLGVEQQEGEAEYRRVAGRFVEMTNEFLMNPAQAGIPELARLPHALDPETGFRKRSEFQFRDMIGVAAPASPIRWLADFFLAPAGLRGVIEKDAREFLRQLLEVNCSRVQNDVLSRIQESRSRLENLETEVTSLLAQ